jgi:hypothetical protein
MYSVGKAPGAFWLGWDTGREPANCAGGRECLRSAAGSQRDRTVPTSMEKSSIGGASLLRLQWTHLRLGFIVARVSGKSMVSGGELSLCRLWIGFKSSMGVEGGGKQHARAKERAAAAR